MAYIYERYMPKDIILFKGHERQGTFPRLSNHSFLVFYQG